MGKYLQDIKCPFDDCGKIGRLYLADDGRVTCHHCSRLVDRRKPLISIDDLLGEEKSIKTETPYKPEEKKEGWERMRKLIYPSKGKVAGKDLEVPEMPSDDELRKKAIGATKEQTADDVLDARIKKIMRERGLINDEETEE